MEEPKDLLGTWMMLSWKKEDVATGETVDAHGPDPVGYITYGSDGRMHAIVVRRDRPPPQILPPTNTEKLRLFDSLLPIRAHTQSMTKRSSTTWTFRGTRHSQTLTWYGSIRVSMPSISDHSRACNRSVFGERSDPSLGISESVKSLYFGDVRFWPVADGSE